jgi:fructokinase
VRIGIDLGGTKIEVAALGHGGQELTRHRIPTPRSSYQDVIRAIAALVRDVESRLERHGTVGLAIPGIVSPVSGLVKNANSTQLLGHPLDRDVQEAIGRKVRVANDANCFAISEANDGAAAGCEVVFGIIAGTGVGGGIAIAGRPLVGAHSIAGEWGHNPLPWPSAEEFATAPPCYCGKRGCIESWVSGPALSSHFARATGRTLNASEIAVAAGHGDAAAMSVMQEFYDRFARSIASIVNVLDPDAIVIGGGLSNIDSLYCELAPRVQALAFSPEGPTRILKNKHGDSSGVRGAAWLWREGEKAGLPA